MDEVQRQALLRHAPPYAVGERVWTVLGDGGPGRSYRGYHRTPGAAEAKAAELLGIGWRVSIVLPA
jgi:hypothetical protein